MSRLFWKIFLWFCLALLLVTVAVGWGVKLYLEIANTEVQRELPATQATALSLAIETSGVDQARDLLARLTSESHRPLFIVDEAHQDLLRRPLPPSVELLALKGYRETERFIVRDTAAPDGRQYRVVVPLIRHRPPHQHGIARAPAWLSLLIALTVGLVVCFWLARYLSGPVTRLSRASRALAAGQLDSRVGSLGGRRDEIAELAQDFDRMAERIQQLLHAQKQLLSDISHELRSPLARLRVAVALARREAPSGSARLALDRIERDIERMEALVSELLTLFKLESTDVPPLNQELDFRSLLEDLVETNSIEATARHCRLQLVAESAVLTGDAELLRRAVENVIRNAILHTAEQSSVSIRSERQGRMLELSVCDRGPGVPESALASLFEPFVRTDSARARRTGGYGLGLAIARRAIELHGGCIAARNRSDGNGLCIDIRLPLATEPDEPGLNAASSSAG